MIRFGNPGRLPAALVGVLAGGVLATALVGARGPDPRISAETGPSAGAAAIRPSSTPVAAALQRDVYQALEVFHGAVMLVREQYLEPVEAEGLMEGAVRGVFDALDEDSTYLSAAETERYRARGDYPASLGIGLEKRYYLHVDHALPGSPADAAGIEAGAAIVSIDGVYTRDLRIPAARLLLQGLPGTPVELAIRNEADSELETVTVERAVLEAHPVSAEVVDTDLAVARIQRFHEATPAQLGAAIAGFRADGARGLLLDLRRSRDDGVGCGAGADAAAPFTSGTGAQLTRRGPGGGEEQTPVPIPEGNPDESWSGPVVVLVDGGTVCPGEVLAAALASRPDLDIIGPRTAGRTGAPELIELPAGDALLISSAHYQTPDGEDILTTGVPATLSAGELEEMLGFRPADLEADDPWLELALRLLRHRLDEDAAAG